MERILRYTEIHTQAATYPADEKISTLLAQLPPVFCNCHRSFAANLNAASSLTRTELLFPNGQKIPVGRNYYHDVKKHF
jgi:DNA-binding LytR/AlgR family response regulator